MLPCTRAAWGNGTFSSGQVQTVVANVRDATAEHFAAQEKSLVPVLAPLSVDQPAVAMRHWRLQAEALLNPPEPSEPSRSLHCSRIMDGRRAEGHLDAEGGELLEAALRQAASPDVEGEPARAAIARRNGARRTTSSTGPRAVRPAWGTRSSAALAIVICSTNRVGISSCCPMPPWRSPPPVGGC